MSPRRYRRRSVNRRGAMLVLIAFLMVGFMVTVAISIDLAHMHLARQELRSATDAAVKAAAIELAQTRSEDAALAKGKAIGRANQVFKQPLTLTNADFEFGRSNLNAQSGAFVFQNGTTPFNSIRVTGLRTDGSTNGGIPLFFGRFWGIENYESTAKSTATFLQRDIVVVVDRSGSMAGVKFVDLISSLVIFKETLGQLTSDERVGLASYASDATEDVQLTSNRDEFEAGVLRLQVAGFTNISGGINAGMNILNRGGNKPFVERTMILMTDGNHNVGPGPIGPARQAANQRVTIHTITFGFDANQAAMREIADLGHGRHFHAANGNQLREAFREIARSLSAILTD